MSTSPRIISARAITIAVATTAGLAALADRLVPAVDLDPAQPFATLLAQWCSVVLLGCAAWAWLATVAVLLEVVRASAAGDASRLPRRAGRGVPAAYRRLLLGACGIALAAGTSVPALVTPALVTPALATPGPVHLAPGAAVAAATAGPSWSDTEATTTAPAVPAPAGSARPAASGPRRPAPTPPDPIVVEPGDSLWRLAAERLPREASDATIMHTWRRLYEANHDLIGADPDLLEPGQRLARPWVW